MEPSKKKLGWGGIKTAIEGMNAQYSTHKKESMRNDIQRYWIEIKMDDAA